MCLPDFDTCESVGLDGTLRTHDGIPWTWEDVARAAILMLEERSDANDEIS